MFPRHDTAVPTAGRADRPDQERISALADPSVPMQACCCPAHPMFKVVMPPTATRPHPVDLWLCGHHYRASRAAVESAGAKVYPLACAAGSAVQAGVPAGVAH